MKVLISGGAGYIGSTIASALLDSGHTPVLLDSLVTGRREFTKDRIFYEADIADRAMVRKIFSDHPDIEATIHCAALIVVPESVIKPYEYYKENVVKSMEFFKLLAELGRNQVVFSSSAALYDVVPGFMVTEESPLHPVSPYSRTKYMMEMVLKDFCSAYGLNGIALRYFNPIGADPKMRTGLHIRYPSHLIGKLVEVALGREPVFNLTGIDWPTRDGSGIRDYIHVWDLASAHIKAVERFQTVIEHGREEEDVPYAVINLGTGHGVTVKEFVAAFEDVYGQKLPVSLQPPRPGDVAGSYANADKAERLLGWKAEFPIEQGIADALKWGKLRDTIIHY
ncbi:MAG: UDP-glucose 4-epimerase GalE [Anaerolineaceae bacterium]|jgi:UDP-glucose 4-epimerase|nr:UDP-glucose 4-epimerase GalE [Anaerolineaceae bacterium]MDI9530662.1 UDP-glucose 4-epimerase GalE [Chloroflexota bacterium]